MRKPPVGGAWADDYPFGDFEMRLMEKPYSALTVNKAASWLRVRGDHPRMHSDAYIEKVFLAMALSIGRPPEDPITLGGRTRDFEQACRQHFLIDSVRDMRAVYAVFHAWYETQEREVTQ